MPLDDLTARLTAPASRRVVVTRGAKLAYAAPLVAASMKLGSGNAAAAISGGPVICEAPCRFSLRLIDGRVVCGGENTSYDPFECCSSDNDCADPAGVCMTSYIVLGDGRLESTTCLSDPSKGNCTRIDVCA
jgi:hypothetical protein